MVHNLLVKEWVIKLILCLYMHLAECVSENTIMWLSELVSEKEKEIKVSQMNPPCLATTQVLYAGPTHTHIHTHRGGIDRHTHWDCWTDAEGRSVLDKTMVWRQHVFQSAGVVLSGWMLARLVVCVCLSLLSRSGGAFSKCVFV